MKTVTLIEFRIRKLNNSTGTQVALPTVNIGLRSLYINELRTIAGQDW
jgi:hypothetical protein